MDAKTPSLSYRCVSAALDYIIHFHTGLVSVTAVHVLENCQEGIQTNRHVFGVQLYSALLFFAGTNDIGELQTITREVCFNPRFVQKCVIDVSPHLDSEPIPSAATTCCCFHTLSLLGVSCFCEKIVTHA